MLLNEGEVRGGGGGGKDKAILPIIISGGTEIH